MDRKGRGVLVLLETCGQGYHGYSSNSLVPAAHGLAEALLACVNHVIGTVTEAKQQRSFSTSSVYYICTKVYSGGYISLLSIVKCK